MWNVNVPPAPIVPAATTADADLAVTIVDPVVMTVPAVTTADLVNHVSLVTN